MPAPFVEDAFFYPLYNFGFFVKNQVSIDVQIYVRVFDSIDLPACFYANTMQVFFIITVAV